MDLKYSHHYESEEILGYIYAVLHSPTYRRRYADFLKIDFPRIPFVDDRRTFEKLLALGWQLVQAHLLKDFPETIKVEVSKGSDQVEKPVYAAPQQRLYFNNEQYFAPVPEDVWNFHIGGYQVLDKYLKSRKGRELSLDEKENVINVVKVLCFTINQMQKIDKIWRP
jgi:predicted helicase